VVTATLVILIGVMMVKSGRGRLSRKSSAGRGPVTAKEEKVLKAA
jgi:hypothetical protein